MDAVKKFEEINEKNNKLFEALFGGYREKKPNLKRVLSDDGRGGFYINNGKWVNHVQSYTKKPGVYIFDENTWVSGQLQWLYNAKFFAMYIHFESFDPSGISMGGVWEGGDFLGKSFTNPLGGYSYFVGGNFKGDRYQAFNRGFGNYSNGNPVPNFSPLNFMGKTFHDNKSGILGRLDLELGQNYDEVELIRIPVGSYLIINKGYGEKERAIRIHKRLDENNSDFIIQDVHSKDTINVKWEDIRRNYSSSGIFTVGKPYVLGTINIQTINSLDLASEYTITGYKKTVTINPNEYPSLAKVGIRGYPFQITVDTEDEIKGVNEFIKSIISGKFYENLKKLREAIQNGKIKGYANYTELAPLFNNIQGVSGIHPDYKGLMDYLVVVKRYLIDLATPQELKEVAQKVSNLIAGQIKKFLGIDQFIKQPSAEEIEQAKRSQEMTRENPVSKMRDKFNKEIVKPTKKWAQSKKTVGKGDDLGLKKR